jgi:antitoxin (DNA-binding transcriptional repressor) of toxin-antitoxin stability system
MEPIRENARFTRRQGFSFRRGEATTITKHGRPAAVAMPVDDARRAYQADRPSFAALLMGIPHAVETERDSSPLREADL